MKKHPISIALVALLAAGLTACGNSNSVTVGEVPTELPTSTPNISPTDLPPPTVTPFPEVTPRGQTVEVSEESDEEDEQEDETAESNDEASDETEAEPEVENEEAPAAPASSGSPFGGTLLYETNFARGWPDVDDETATISSSGGLYRMELGPFDARFFTTNGIGATNSYTQVEVTPEACPPQGGYGLIFRYQDVSGYYQFTLFCSGTYSGIARVDGRPASGGTNGDLPFDAAENTTRTLGILAEGSSFTLFVDGEELDSFSDNRFDAGDVGVAAISQTGEVINVNFGNLQVYSLP